MEARPTMRIIAGKMPIIIYFGRDLPAAFVLHGGTSNRGAPQSAPFGTKELEEKFLKGPPVGISPSSLLKDKFRDWRRESASRDFGMTPERLLLDKSSRSKLREFPIELGMLPTKLLFAKESETKFSRPPKLLGIEPDKWLFDKSIYATTSKLPTSSARGPLRLLDDSPNNKMYLSSHKEEGIVEDNILYLKSSLLSDLDRLPKQEGIVPDSSLLDNSKSARLSS